MEFRKSELILAIVSALSLASCGGSGSSSSGGGSSDSGSGTANISVSLDVLNGKDSAVIYKLGSSDYSYLSASTENGSLVLGDDGYPVFRFNSERLSDPDFVLTTEEVPYEATSTSGTVSGVLTVSYGNDPLINHQWYIRATSPEASGYYLKSDMIDGLFFEAWRKAVSGDGAVVAVLDDGLEIKHHDLSANVISGSYNYVYAQYKKTGESIPEGMTETDPTPFSKGDAHGTNVAGIIAAASANDRGISGIAPKAKLIGFNVMSSLLSTYWQNAGRYDAYRKILGRGDVDVINESFGSYDGGFYADDNMSAFHKALYDAGTVRVSSSGNYFAPDEDLNAKATSEAIEYQECYRIGTNCVWTQNGPGDYLPWVVKAAAVGADGVHTSYSSAGSNLLVAGFGGEVTGPLLYSTDLSGCSKGYNRETSADDRECRYYSSFVGTSAAAPTVTGLVALLKGKYSSLTASQVRWILAKSARNDDDLPQISYVPVKSGDITVDEGWIGNDAGLRFSRRYGFGVIDASAALTAAEGCSGDAECAARAASPEQYTVELSCTRASPVRDNASESTVWAGTYDSDIGKYMIGTGYDTGHEVSTYLSSQDQHYTCKGSALTDSNGTPVSGTFTVDSVLLTVSDFSFKEMEAGGISVCGSSALEYQTPMTGSETADFVNTVARSKLGFSVTSPAGTYSVLKGFFENSSGSLNFGTVSVNALTNAPMGEHVSSGEEWSADIYSWCDLEDNYDAELTVYAHRLN